MQPTAGERIEHIEHIDTAIDDIRGALAGQTKASFTDNMMLRLAAAARNYQRSVTAYSGRHESLESEYVLWIER